MSTLSRTDAAHLGVPPRLLFDCPAAGSLLSPGSRCGIGGAEVRAVTFANHLAAQEDWAVDFVVQASPPAPSRWVGKVRVHDEMWMPPEQDIPWRRWPAPLTRMTQRWCDSLARRLWELPPRRPFFESVPYAIVLSFGLTNRTAAVVRSARRAGRRSVIFLTSDRNLVDLRRHGRRDRGVYGELGELCRYAICHADAVVVQKAEQQQMLLDEWQLASTLIRNPIDVARREEQNGVEASEMVAPGPWVLWVGRADRFSKRADVAIEIARRTPSCRFLLIMNRHDEQVFAELTRSLPANVVVVDQVPFDRIDAYYRRASVLLNTSVAEGFPNAFLQAAKYGVPIVSLQVDPDQVLSRERIGVGCDGDVERCSAALHEFAQGGEAACAVGRRGQAYVRRHHATEVCGQQLAELLQSLLKQTQSGGATSSPALLSGRA